jgi:hypothetical protein
MGQEAACGAGARSALPSWTADNSTNYDPRAMRHTFFFYDSPA